MHAHLEGVGLKARPLTLKLTTDSGYQTESFRSPTTLKMLSKGLAAKRDLYQQRFWGNLGIYPPTQLNGTLRWKVSHS